MTLPIIDKIRIKKEHIEFEWKKGDHHFNLYCDGEKSSHLYYSFGYDKKEVTESDFKKAVNNYIDVYGNSCLE